jgi:hypothetical protein
MTLPLPFIIQKLLYSLRRNVGKWTWCVVQNYFFQAGVAKSDCPPSTHAHAHIDTESYIFGLEQVSESGSKNGYIQI